MNNTYFIWGIFGGFISYYVYLNSSLSNALLVLGFIAIVSIWTSSWQGLWNLAVKIKSPHFTALALLMIGFTYYSIQGGGFWPSNLFSVGTALIGFAIGMFIYGLWNLR